MTEEEKKKKKKKQYRNNRNEVCVYTIDSKQEFLFNGAENYMLPPLCAIILFDVTTFLFQVQKECSHHDHHSIRRS